MRILSISTLGFLSIMYIDASKDWHSRSLLYDDYNFRFQPSVVIARHCSLVTGAKSIVITQSGSILNEYSRTNRKKAGKDNKCS